MPVSLSGRHFLRLLDFSTEEIEYLLKLSKNFKDMKRAGVPHRYLEGKNIVLLFQKTSTRTRCAFEVGAMDLGMGVTYLDPNSSQMGKKESIEDTARVLGRFYDGIEFRGFAQTDVEELAANAGVPVWNGLTTEWHPTQMLADVLTMQENFNYDLKGRTVVFMADPDEVWGERIKNLEPYRVTKEVMGYAKEDAIFLHCLPSFHDTNTTIGAQKAEQFGITEMEVADDVFESKQSKVFDEAENRMHTIKAVMYATLS